MPFTYFCSTFDGVYVNFFCDDVSYSVGKIEPLLQTCPEAKGIVIYVITERCIQYGTIRLQLFRFLIQNGQLTRLWADLHEISAILQIT